MSESILSELLVRISAETDSSLEESVTGVRGQLEFMADGFKSLSSAGILAISAVNSETSKLVDSLILAEGLQKKLMDGLSGDSSRETNAGERSINMPSGMRKPGPAETPENQNKGRISIGSIVVNVGGMKKSDVETGVSVNSNDGGLNIRIPEKLMMGLKSDVRALGR